ncbi:MAG: hypothetical protein KGV44_12140 [Flavobacteriaceae bacterium]|nr:hypothetical protein [Flavobacteriaceae bacterium]
MKEIEEIEKHLPSKQKSLLFKLRENNWKVVEINDDYSDWCYEKKWIIESVCENKGFQIQLWFFNHGGLYDSVDRVECTKIDTEQPNYYGGNEDFTIWFNGRKFEQQLKLFVENIHILRCTNNST